MISLTFCISDNYAQHLVVFLASIAEYNTEDHFIVHIIHSNITTSTQERITQFCLRYPNFRFEFHSVDSNRFDGIEYPPGLEHISVEGFYRYLIPEILTNEARTIYSDVDVLCFDKIRPLWELDLQGYPIGLVPATNQHLQEWVDYKKSVGIPLEHSYCASGLIVMDLNRLRDDKAVQKLFSKTADLIGKSVLVDQDAINITFANNVKLIDDEWNHVDGWPCYGIKYKMLHFAGWTSKPWCNIWKNLSWMPYLRFLLKTPYKGNALRFVLGHIVGWFYYRYTKKQVDRILVLGIRVWKRKLSK